MNQEQLDFLSKHPGGFDEDSVAKVLPIILGEYQQHRELDAATSIVLLELRDGRQLPITGVRAAVTWAAWFTEADEMVLVPYSEIVTITVQRRPPNIPTPKNPVGFTGEVVKS
jgi:hypothetical protein